MTSIFQANVVDLAFNDNRFIECPICRHGNVQIHEVTSSPRTNGSRRAAIRFRCGTGHVWSFVVMDDEFGFAVARSFVDDCDSAETSA